VTEPADWKRFGPDDIRGALNHIDAEKIKAATTLVRLGQVIPLNTRVDEPHAPFHRPPPRRTVEPHNLVRFLPPDRYTVMNDEVLEFGLQASSHIDAFAHFGIIEPHVDGVYYGGAGFNEVWPEPKAKRLGVDAFGGGIVTRGVVLDVVAAAMGANADNLPDDFRIDAALIRECLTRQGIALQRGDAVLIFTGFERRREANGGVVPPASPGVDASTLEIWRAEQIALLAADNPAVEPMPIDYAIHIGALRNLGIPLGEFWALQQLVDACRGDGVYEFLLVSVPINLPGAFGSPANAVAIR
jgi:kynurenine formamidase